VKKIPEARKVQEHDPGVEEFNDCGLGDDKKVGTNN